MTGSAAIAPGKLVLLGEYAVLEGGPAWVAAVDRFVRAAAKPGPARLTVFAPDERDLPLTRSGDAWTTAPGWEIAAAALTAAFGENVTDVSIDSREFYLPGADGAPTKAGYGSSSAVVAAVLALGKYAGAPVEARYAAAREVHHRAQGRLGSGVDIAAAVFGGAFVFQRAEVTASLALPADLRVVPVWLGASASTPLLVGRVLEWKRSAPDEYQALIDEMATTASVGIDYLQQGDTGGFIEAAADYGRRMGQLGRSAGVPIVTPAMEDLAGAVAGRAAFKPSGAGGGDVGLFFTEADREAEVRADVERAGGRIIPLKFGAAGAAPVALEEPLR